MQVSGAAPIKRGESDLPGSAATDIPTVAARQLWRDGQTAACSASTPCQLRVTSFASKFRLVDRHPLYVPARAAPHVRASHYGLRLAHDSEQYDRGPKITNCHYRLANAIGYCEAVGRVSGMSRRRDSPLWCGVGCRKGMRWGGCGRVRCVWGCGARAPGVGALRWGCAA